MKKLALLILLTSCTINANTELIEEIKTKVDQTSGLGNYQLEILDTQGDIELKGTVESERVRQKIESIARSVDGIKEFKNEIEVVPSNQAAIETSKQKIAGLEDIEDYQVSLTDADGQIVVHGYAGSPEDAAKILDTVRANNPGAKIVNEIEVTGPKSDADVEDLILSNLAKAGASARGLAFDVNNGIAHVSGDATSTTAVDRALSVVVMTKGVKGIESTVEINGQKYANPEYLKDTLRQTGERTFAD